jgi:hypothetical protein
MSLPAEAAGLAAHILVIPINSHGIWILMAAFHSILFDTTFERHRGALDRLPWFIVANGTSGGFLFAFFKITPKHEKFLSQFMQPIRVIT